jgi:two-component system CheB/CheR fusion protein
VLEKHAPAAVLINAKYECLNLLGPTKRYLQVASGEFTSDLLAMVQPDIRSRLRSAIQQASEGNVTVIVRGIQPQREENGEPFTIFVEPIENDEEQLLVVCFVSDPEPGPKASLSVPAEEVSRVAELESALDATRAELQDAVRRLEVSGEEQKATNEEALSVNEEYQSTNEELLTSKEELQALNEELTALNSQLQETLERSRTTSNDLQNILYSTDVATLFLDANLNIRFFTPATRSLFSVITSDVGRPLADLHSLSADNTLLVDAQTVLGGLPSVEREIEAQNGAFYVRRILPYQTHDSRIEGVVITFTDITERRRTAKALEAAMQRAELATAAKSRFLAAASHDLRQPLQTLKLIEGLLAKKALSETTQELVGMLNPTLSAMSGMLNTLLDMDQIDTGTIKVEIRDFAINDLIGRLRDEFTYHADARGLTLHAVSCGLWVRSDPRLLERILRNLLSNASKYTEHGKVLLGCRRHGGAVSIEVWDTGVGIPDEELLKIFEEYHQIDNAARDRALGLGLGLAVVHRLGKLLGHRVSVHSRVGKGSVFSIVVETQLLEARPLSTLADEPARGATEDAVCRTGTILIVEDDAELRKALSLLFTEEGHQVAAAADGAAAMDLLNRGKFRPQLIVSDYNLPNGMNGLQVVSNLRQKLHRQVPAIILTGDISREFLQDIAGHDCAQLTKPIKAAVLTGLIERLLPARSALHHRDASTAVEIPGTPGPPTIFVVDDDSHIRTLIRRLLEENGHIVADYATCEAFVDAYRPGREACLLVDAYLPGMHGLELLQRLNDEGYRLPTIMITGSSDVPLALQAMQAGASDFIEKPINGDELIASVKRALEQSSDFGKRTAVRQAASRQVAGLTDRQREIMGMVLAGHPSKNIAADLHISQRTVENHRASIMKRTGSKSLPDLARLALAAGPVDPAGHAIDGAGPIGHGVGAPGERSAI